MTNPVNPETTSMSEAGPDLAHHEPLADAGVRTLLERYAALSGGAIREIGPHLYELHVPAVDRAAFGNRASIRIAFSVEALQEDATAEMAVVGSVFVDQLIAAARQRGARRAFGLVPPTVSPLPEEAVLPAAVANGQAGVPQARIAKHPVARLTARITVRAGATLEEHLVESGLFDLATGTALGTDVAAACEAATAQGMLPNADGLPPRPASELIPLMLGDLERRIAPEVDRQQVNAKHDLDQELTRIDRYYRTLLEDSAGRRSDIPDAGARRAVEAEHERRRNEEIGRHEVRATVHPVQLAEWTIPVQRADWILTSTDGHTAPVVAQRTLVGGATWALACPTCGSTAPTSFTVCHKNHAGCAECATQCGVCSTGFCRNHGLLACHVDGAPACSSHARTCRSCHREHCSAHEALCVDGDHMVCTSCLTACAHCGRVVCDEHATESNPDAARGVRRLCNECVRHCEGGTGEVVGPDEVTRCTTCDRVVCVRHQTTCAVDHQVHCSSHMRRTDRSRRLVCDADRAACTHERNAIFARDEVTSCASCRASACAEHTGTCAEDGQRHCTTHLVPLRDRKAELACMVHHSTCHVDGVTYSLAGTEACPVCGRRACDRHRMECSSCGRNVCLPDMDVSSGAACRTCRQLSAVSDVDDLLLQAVNAALRDDVKPKAWRVARDATHRVVAVDLGWTRKAVIAVRHGSDSPDTLVRHSVLGRKRSQ